MDRTIREATVKRFQCENHDPLRIFPGDLIPACTFANCLRTLAGFTSCDDFCKIRTSWQDRFILDPTHQMSGRNKATLQRMKPAHAFGKVGGAKGK